MVSKQRRLIGFVPNKLYTQDIPLPFYVYSTGTVCIENGQIEKVSGLADNHICLFWSIKGIGKIVSNGTEWICRKDHVNICYPGEDSVKTSLTESWEYRWFELAGPLACATVIAYGFARLMPAYTAYPAKLFEELDELCRQKSLFAQRRSCAVVSEILARVDGRFSQIASYEIIVDNALNYIQEHLSAPELNVVSLAEHLGVSRTKLTMLFRQRGLPPPGREILNRRLGYAAELIGGTDMPVHEMSRACGFADPHTFSRFIRRALGNSPLQLRKGKLPIQPRVP